MTKFSSRDYKMTAGDPNVDYLCILIGTVIADNPGIDEEVMFNKIDAMVERASSLEMAATMVVAECETAH